MEKVGVAAVVEGLSGFLGDMKKIDSSISGLIPGTKLLENAFGFLGDTINGFVNFTLNALAHALGELIADAVEFVIQKLGELVQATIEAGGEFQTLELRLQTLNFNSLTESGMEFNEATAESIRLTKEQLEWLQKLAVQTPYDAADIANTFTLARSYGFVDEEARTLTETITNFASGMGLGNTEIERIIINFGQMVQQGKVTQRELNDLARGSFVPVNDILKLMGENLGIAASEMDDFRKTGESVPAFMEAFIQLVEQRFTGSAEKMARTFQGATANLKDLIKSIGGMNIIKPILDVIGDKIATFISKLTEGKRWDAMVKAAKKLGDALASVAFTFLGILPSADRTAEGVVKALRGIADWVNDNRPKITDFVIELRRWIHGKLLPAIQEVWKWLFGKKEESGALEIFGKWLRDEFVPAVMAAAKWVGEVLVPFLKNDLLPVFMALLPLASAIGEVLLLAFGGTPNQDFTTWIHETLIPGIQTFTEWIIKNKDEIALWVERLVTATLQLAIFAAFVTMAISVVTTIAAAFLDWLVVSGEWVKVLTVIAIGWAIVSVAMSGALATLLLIGAAIAGVILAFLAFKMWWEEAKAAWEAGVASFMEKIELFRVFVTAKVQEIVNAWKSGDWVGVGVAIVEGIIQGMLFMQLAFVDVFSDMAQAAYSSVLGTFGIETGGMSSRAAGSTVSSSVNTTNNFNLAINGVSGGVEPIVQDFNMLRSLQGR